MNFEDFVRRAFREGQRTLDINVDDRGATITVQVADKGPRVFVVNGNSVAKITEPVNKAKP